jgi:hypothetical protein
MPDTGSPISAQGFGYVRDIPSGSAGLISVPLDAAVMAHSGIAPTRLRDLRVIDNANFQIPYLLELRDEPLIARATLDRRDLPAGIQQPGGRVTSYAVKVPFPQLPNARLVLTTKARVFQRTVTLATVMAASERQPARLASNGVQAWIHADQSVAAPSLVFPLPDSSKGELFLLVEEGDNQPLPFDEVSVLMPAYALRLFRRPNVPLRLMYGRADLAAPQYDLQLLASQVMGRAAEDVALGPEQVLAGARSSSFELVSPTMFWVALGLTVVVLLGLVARLVTRETPA